MANRVSVSVGVRLSLSRDPSLDSLAARSAPLPRLALLGSRRSASRGRGWRFEADRSATANAAAVIDAPSPPSTATAPLASPMRRIPVAWRAALARRRRRARSARRRWAHAQHTLRRDARPPAVVSSSSGRTLIAGRACVEVGERCIWQDSARYNLCHHLPERSGVAPSLASIIGSRSVLHRAVRLDSHVCRRLMMPWCLRAEAAAAAVGGAAHGRGWAAAAAAARARRHAAAARSTATATPHRATRPTTIRRGMRRVRRSERGTTPRHPHGRGGPPAIDCCHRPPRRRLVDAAAV